MAAFVLTIESEPDRDGRQTFVLDWTQDGRRRGQYFRAVVDDHVRDLRARGHEVEVRQELTRRT